jgi:hypothetical protein
VGEIFTYAQETHFKTVVSDHHRTINKGHGRIEIRQCWAITNLTAFDYIRNLEAWKGVRSIGTVLCERRTGDVTTTDTAYYIASLLPNAERLLDATRSHWRLRTPSSGFWTLLFVKTRAVSGKEMALRTSLSSAISL